MQVEAPSEGSRAWDTEGCDAHVWMPCRREGQRPLVREGLKPKAETRAARFTKARMQSNAQSTTMILAALMLLRFVVYLRNTD